LILAGACLNALPTSYLPHVPDGNNEWFQYRVFRGRAASVVAREHLIHLEHHLDPAAPHHNWPKPANRLDGHPDQVGVEPMKLWF
jgi:beta-carotene hydroxylase